MSSFNLIILSGPPIEQPKTTVKLIDRAGVDGLAYRLEAKKPRETVWQTMEKMNDVDDANDRPEDYAELIGTSTSFTDSNGRIVSGCIVLDVTVTKIQPVAACSDSSVKALVFAVWTVIVPQISG